MSRKTYYFEFTKGETVSIINALEYLDKIHEICEHEYLIEYLKEILNEDKD